MTKAAKEILNAPTPADIRRDGPKGGWNSVSMTTQHTPTPWTMQHEFDNEPSYIVDEQDCTIAVCQPMPLDPFPAHNNAAFIVRAVNSHDALVKALEEAAGFCEASLACDGSYDPAEETLKSIRAALAQAKG